MVARGVFFRSHHLPVLSVEQSGSQSEEINVIVKDTRQRPFFHLAWPCQPWTLDVFWFLTLCSSGTDILGSFIWCNKSPITVNFGFPWFTCLPLKTTRKIVSPTSLSRRAQNSFCFVLFWELSVVASARVMGESQAENRPVPVQEAEIRCKKKFLWLAILFVVLSGRSKDNSRSPLTIPVRWVACKGGSVPTVLARKPGYPGHPPSMKTGPYLRT